jgi:hypothetical protein
MAGSWKQPPRPICALCGYDDYVQSAHLGDGLWEHRCSGPQHVDARTWQETVGGSVDELALEGLAQEWGLYDDLPRCLVPGEPMVEYGVVEHRYKELNPACYRALVARYSHTSLGPKNYTASSFIAGALGRLLKRGELEAIFATATGYWSYNGTISYWALPGSSPESTPLTWEAFARGRGIDPSAWTV